MADQNRAAGFTKETDTDREPLPVVETKGWDDIQVPAALNGPENRTERPQLTIDITEDRTFNNGRSTRPSGNKPKSSLPSSPTSPIPVEPRVYKRRWFMLTVFCLVSMTNAAQWIQYAIIGNVVRDFYSISYLAVDGLSMIYMLAYIPLIWPVTWLLERNQGGLKVIGVMGASLNCAGAWLRYAGATPDTFLLAFLGQTL